MADHEMIERMAHALVLADGLDPSSVRWPSATALWNPADPHGPTVGQMVPAEMIGRQRWQFEIGAARRAIASIRELTDDAQEAAEVLGGYGGDGYVSPAAANTAWRTIIDHILKP